MRKLSKIKIFLLRLFYRRLWVKIAAMLLLLVTVPVVLLGFLLISTSQEAVRNSVLNNHKEIAVRAAEEIKLFIKGPEGILKTTAAMLEVVYPAPWKQETVLVELVLNRPVFMRVSSIDLLGGELASSELGRKSSWPHLKEALEKINKGQDYASNVMILNNHTPYLTMAVPIRKMGKVVGALIGDINLRGIWGIIDNIQIEATGRAFLVSNNGILIAHQDKKRVLKNEDLNHLPYIQSVLKNQAGSIESLEKTGKRWIVSYAPVSHLGWGFVLRQEQDEAYLFSKVMKMQSWMIIILSELIAIAVSIFMAKLLIMPIKTLASRIKRVAEGDFGHKIEIKRRDEIGGLVRSFNNMSERLKKAKSREQLSAIGEAASWITHELKNSLVSIKTFVQLFPQKHKDREFIDRFSKLMPEEIERWEHMLKGISNFSSNSALLMEKIDLKELISGILETMSERLIEKRINVRYSPQTDNLYIRHDPQKLKQVFMNVIINAINAMPAGGSIVILLSSNSTSAEVRIIDTGKGIPSDALEKIFESFYAIEKGGMGLGLAISRSIIEQHGGTIILESQVGKGTTVVMKLPLEVEKG
ncbi:ATP-binding protein [Candidatus Omnitrophota bacterium]